jgi:hypothetical protein
MSCVPLMPAGSLKQDPSCQGKRAGILSPQPLGFLILMGSTKCSRPKGLEEPEQTGSQAPICSPPWVPSRLWLSECWGSKAYAVGQGRSLLCACAIAAHGPITIG